MTPKEKAEDLIQSFTFKCIECDYINNAKQCALIAVDEILNFIHTDAFSYTNEEYWHQVKQEIEKL